VRAVIQAYLHRSAADIERLNAAGIQVRLCKGAYNEPDTIAFAEKREVDRTTWC
jgi:proline dehydrogenase